MNDNSTDRVMFPEEWESEVICRKRLDEKYGNLWICGCEKCNRERKEKEDGDVHVERD